MTNICDVFGHSLPLTTYEADEDLPLPLCRVGVEVEVENVRHANTNGTLWQSVSDDSLRDRGIEFVFANPYFGKDIALALSQLPTILADDTPVFSHRTSVHVHIDCRDMTRTQIVYFIMAYAIMERDLMAHFNTGREDNIFAIPLYKGMQDVTRIGMALTSDNTLRSIVASRSRYSAIGLASLEKFGSLEFRQLAGTASQDIIMSWIRVLLSLKAWALSTSSPSDIINGACTMPDTVIQTLTQQRITFTAANMIAGARVAQAILNAPLLQVIGKSYTDRITNEVAAAQVKKHHYSTMNAMNGVDTVSADTEILNRRAFSTDFAQTIMQTRRPR